MWKAKPSRAISRWSVVVMLICCGVFWPSFVAGAGHPFHTSIAEVDWNGETKSFEVALSLWPVDVERLLQQPQEGESETGNWDLDDPANHDKIDARLKDYVLSKFRLTVMPAVSEREDSNASGPEPSKYEWLGLEVEKDAVWVYFRVIPAQEVAARLPREAPAPAARGELAESEVSEDEPPSDAPAATEEATEVAPPESRSVVRLRLRDEVLLEIQPEQRNTITLRIAGRRETFEFNGERATRAVEWPITWEP